MDELHCNYVGSYALLKISTHRSPTPISDFGGLNTQWYSNLYPNCNLYICPPALPAFVKNVLPNISVPFKLITNNADYTLPRDFENETNTLLNNTFLVHWFAQNFTLSHPKITRIPIGVDYHSLHIELPKITFMRQPALQHPNGWGIRKPAVLQERDLLQIKSQSRPFFDREVKAYANFHFFMQMGYAVKDRPDAYNTIPKELVFYEPVKTQRNNCWINMARYAFVVSPHGNGLDCHRTWEALALGCIPIVKSSGIDPLFDELPVWIVKEWSDVTADAMRTKIEELRNINFNYDKLTVGYWKSKIVSTY